VESLDPLLTSKQAGAILGVEPATMAVWRCLGTRPQPIFIRFGRSVRYRQSDLMRFIADSTVSVNNQDIGG
jgi:hypothetical protein